YEKPDNRYVVFLDDVIGAKFSNIKMVKAKDINTVIKLKNASNVIIQNAVYYDNTWGVSPTEVRSNTSGILYPGK
ncbi:MAG TPA: hypothetical protein VMY77_15465, partial [Chitinophagaceae bacterium]|nr:hypothetical protein [Chitinophagaceae bacterium]